MWRLAATAAMTATVATATTAAIARPAPAPARPVLPAGVALHAPVPEHAAHILHPEALGFVADLHRAFKAAVGMTPKEYRNSLKPER